MESRLDLCPAQRTVSGVNGRTRVFMRAVMRAVMRAGMLAVMLAVMLAFMHEGELDMTASARFESRL